MSAQRQHKPHDGQGWLGKESRETRRPKKKWKQPKPQKAAGRRPYVA